MKNFFYILFVFILVLSCTGRTIFKKPDNLIQRDKMITIWTDLYLASGAKSVKKKTLEKNKNYIPLVLEKHNIDSVQFSESNFYYTSRIDEYEKMFEEVRIRLKALKDIYDPKTELDSIIESSKNSLKRSKSKDSAFSLNRQNDLKKVKN